MLAPDPFPDEMTDEQWIAAGYTYSRDLSHLPASVQGVYGDYFGALSVLDAISENQTDDAMLGMISNAAITARNAAQNLSLGNGLTSADRDKVVAVFQGTADNTVWAYNQVINNSPSWGSNASQFMQDLSPEVESQFGFFRGSRFWRAVLRVAVAIAVTTVIVAIPVASVAAIKANSILVGAAKAKKVLLYGVQIGNFNVNPTLVTGMSAGLKNAQKNWNKPWQGISEFTFGIKIKPL